LSIILTSRRPPEYPQRLGFDFFACRAARSLAVVHSPAKYPCPPRAIVVGPEVRDVLAVPAREVNGAMSRDAGLVLLVERFECRAHVVWHL
jgi:hypothetical protein